MNAPTLAQLAVLVGPCPRDACGGVLIRDEYEGGAGVDRCSLCSRSPQEPRRAPTVEEREGVVVGFTSDGEPYRKRQRQTSYIPQGMRRTPADTVANLDRSRQWSREGARP